MSKKGSTDLAGCSWLVLGGCGLMSRKLLTEALVRGLTMSGKANAIQKMA